LKVARDLIKLRFDRKAQARIDKLARKCNQGKLTDVERSEYETLCLRHRHTSGAASVKGRYPGTLQHARCGAQAS
jgi:hypothetical protein